MISPVSIIPVLLMLALGADGETKRVILEGLEIEEDQIPTVFSLIKGLEIKSANNLFVSDTASLKKTFLKEVKALAKALPEIVDFKSPSAKERIDSWVKENTNNKIDKLFDNLDPNTALVLANAVYFKDSWKTKFPEHDTVSKPFLETDKDQVSMVDTMSVEGSFPYYKGQFSESVTLPYSGDTAMRVVKPLSGSDEEILIEGARIRYPREGTVDLPKFKSEFKTSLNGILDDLGMGIMFTDRADFSKMSEEPLKVDSTIHRTFIEVNEEGTEAAAVTGVAMVRCASVFMDPPKAFEFKADRSFFYEIFDTKTGLIIFIGKIIKP